MSERTKLDRRKVLAAIPATVFPFGVVAKTGCASMASLGPIELLPSFDDGFGIAAPRTAQDGKLQIYSRTAPDPGWHILQWGISSNWLSAFRPRLNDPETYVASSASCEVVVSGEMVSLTQLGRFLECEDDQRQPREFDLFFSPVALKSNCLPITRLRAIEEIVDFEAKWKFDPGLRRCSVTQLGGLTACVLTNLHAKQTLFHQVHFGVEKIEGGVARSVNRHGRAWFFKENPFGVDDFSIGNGFPRVNLTFDRLPLLRKAINGGPQGMDRTLENWFLAGAYAGQHIWGDAELNTIWRKFSLEAICL